MLRDFKSWMMALIFALPVLLIIFIGLLYFGNCGLNNDCSQASLAPIFHTPIPTIIPATMPAPVRQQISTGPQKCMANAETLLAAWVDNGYSENEPFLFVDNKGATCQAVFSEIQIIFNEANLWYSGALACISCHNANISAASARMDLSSYSGIIAGSQRTSQDAAGKDILGGGDWEKAKLRDMLFVLKKMPFGRPEGAVAVAGPIVQVGNQADGNATPTPSVTVSDVPRPSNPGGPGDAVDLIGDAEVGAQLFVSNCSICHADQGLGGVVNSGSSDGTIPPLNPMDPLLKDSNLKTYITNLDLFIQHGSTPAGTNPVFSMPAWGDTNSLSQQQIADVIAYLIRLNP
jgi:mono/diheme cytochrome c family protein/cytochrome c553